MPKPVTGNEPSRLPSMVGTAGALGTLAWLVARAGPEFMAQVFLLAAPVRIVTGYVDVPARVPALRHAKNGVNVLSMGAASVLNSFPSLVLGVTGMYTEGSGGQSAAEPRPRRRSVLQPVRFESAPEPVTIDAPLQPPALGEPGPPPAPAMPDLLADLDRCRRQLWWWSSAVAAGTWLVTGQVRRALAVMLAGSPSALVTALAVATWREAAHWEQKGLRLHGADALMHAGEVNLVLFDLPGRPAPDLLARLQAVIPRLHERRYTVGLLTDQAPPELRALACAAQVDLWYVGAPAARARWVRDVQDRGHRVAVIGTAPASLPAMDSAPLSLPAGQANQVPEFLAASRRSTRNAGHVITASRTLALAATVATAAGVLAATNVLTVANILGLGLITANQLLRRRVSREKSQSYARGQAHSSF